MFKPLLRTLPSLNGNAKIACDLLDYEKVTDKTNRATYIANVRGAKLLPLSSDKFQYIFKVNLLNSTYEYDIKSYYNYNILCYLIAIHFLLLVFVYCLN